MLNGSEQEVHFERVVEDQVAEKSSLLGNLEV
jgi:hypothetical protein